MGRYRSFVRNEHMNSSELSKKRASTEIFKYTHNKFYNKKDITFNINYNTLEFTSFRDYSTFMDLVKIFQTYSNIHHDVTFPQTINEALKSHIYSSEMLICAKQYANQSIEITNTHVYDNPTLYNHGHIFKVNVGTKFQFPSKIYLDMCTPSHPQIIPHYESCMEPEHIMTFPSQHNFISCSIVNELDESYHHTIQPHTKAYAVFPRHTKTTHVYPISTPRCETNDKTCGIALRMKHLVQLKLKKQTCCNTNL